DCYDDQGILIHLYGPHIFHTSSVKVWNFLSRFTSWHLYQHQVKAFVDGRCVTIPVNLNTMEELFNRKFTPEQMSSYMKSVAEDITEPADSEQVVLSRVGRELYSAFFENYTSKQWGVSASELGPEVCGRIPVRLNRDDRYFSDQYQGMPLNGFTRLFQSMLEHENISILLQTDYFKIRQMFSPKMTIYTGELDAYFEKAHGALPYRCLEFEFRSFARESYQDWPVINYPNDYDFTRIAEYKKITGQSAGRTTVSLEYPGEHGVPCYPLPTPGAVGLAQKYLKEASKLKDIQFLGRLGRYKYINMDRAVLDAMELSREIIAKW
ncbi:MAG: UDP-galactopyranose mutase, partial [Desulfonatronovibrio sp.]